MYLSKNQVKLIKYSIHSLDIHAIAYVTGSSCSQIQTISPNFRKLMFRFMSLQLATYIYVRNNLYSSTCQVPNTLRSQHMCIVHLQFNFNYIYASRIFHLLSDVEMLGYIGLLSFFFYRCFTFLYMSFFFVVFYVSFCLRLF